MRMPPLFLLGGILSFLSMGSCHSEESNPPPYQQNQDLEYVQEENDTVIWLGPGFYYGLWFGSEVEFNNYQYYHGHGHRHGHHHDHGHGDHGGHGGGHHDHGHGHHGGHEGGGHHGGDHAGGHRGGSHGGGHGGGSRK